LPSSYRIAVALVAGLLVASLLLVLPATGGTVRPRHKCSKSYTRHISAVLLAASRLRPGCGRAALMASDIEHDAQRRFPRPLRSGYVAYAYGTNKAGDPRARYRCAISNKLILARVIPCAALPLAARTSRATTSSTCLKWLELPDRRPVGE
jgi:hypothetical protein